MASTSLASGLLTTNALLFEGRGMFRGVNIHQGTVSIYDGVDATGKLLFRGSAEQAFSDSGIRFTEGLYVDVETGDGEAVVYWGS